MCLSAESAVVAVDMLRPEALRRAVAVSDCGAGG
jgi:hypothetical protein